MFEPGGLPRYGHYEAPQATGKLKVIKVRAAALTNLDVLIAQGRHPFSPKAGSAVVGREAVVLSPSGERLFLTTLLIPTPFGSMAEHAVADLSLGLPVPEGVSDALAAAIGNAGLAAWLPLSWRARLAPGETVLVLGATGASGRIAVAAARALGAGRVVAAGRDPAILERLLSSGADAIVRLDESADLTTSFRHVIDGGVDVVLDYLNGPPAEAALEVMATGGRMVQIGSAVAPAITLPALTARVRNLDVLGFAYHHTPIAQQGDAYAALCQAALDGVLDLEIKSLPLSAFDVAWAARGRGARARYVLHP